MIKNIPTPALVLVIWVIDSNNAEAFLINSETSSVRPFVINFADDDDNSEKSPLETLNANVNNPITKAITPNTNTVPARVSTKSFAVNANIIPPGY